MHDIVYEGSVYRPPSEAYSLIVQSTVGCSHNGCAFCSMYRTKAFRIRRVAEVLDDLAAARCLYSRVGRIFLADGDALIRPADGQLEILRRIAEQFPECERVTCYASPKSVEARTDAELLALREAGLKMAYLGLESGSDRVLSQVNKGADVKSIILAGQRLKRAGIKLSVTAIAGLGGRELSGEHAELTGAALSKMQPDYIGILSLMLEPGTPLAQAAEAGSFLLPSAAEMLQEIRTVLVNTDSEGSIFRANHASNYVDLRGTLNRDREALLRRIDRALASGAIKNEAWRAL